MKFNKSYIVASLVALAMSVTACFQPVEGNPEPDTDNAPSPITEDMINREASVVLPGEYHIIFKSLPEESNMLYVKAEYKVDNGKTIYKTMSVYSDTLVLEGFGSNEEYYNPAEELYEYPIKLYSVSRAGAESPAYETFAQSQGPAVDVVAETIEFAPSFSSMVLSCKNPQGKNLDVCAVLEYLDDLSTPQVSKVYAITSEDSVKTIIIDNIPGGEYNVTAYVSDSYGNTSDIMGPFWVPTLSDEKIIGKPADFEAGEYADDPRLWTFLSNDRLYGNEYDVVAMAPKTGSAYAAAFVKDSLRNAVENYSSGKIKYFWDGITENESSKANDANNPLSHFYTGPIRQNGVPGYWAYPYSYFIDLGRDVELSRVIVNQAYDGGQIYGQTGTKVFQLWGRADGGDSEANLLTGWELIGTYSIDKPLNATDQMSMFLKGHSFDIMPADEDGVPQLSKPYRYIRFKGLEPFEPGKENTWYRYSESNDTYYSGQNWNSLKDKPADAVVVKGTPYEAKMSEITFYGQDSYIAE
jgi:hypothetical protein